MLSLIAAKGLVLGVLFVMTLSLGMIPVKLMTVIQHSASHSEENGGTRRRNCRMVMYKKVLSFLSCFAAGVFLATCFLDLLPTVRKRLTTVLFEMDIHTGFPLAEFVMSFGLFLILIVEQIVLQVKERRNEEGTEEERKTLLGINKENSERDRKADFVQSDHSIAGINGQRSVERARDPEAVHSQNTHENQSHHHDHSHDIDFQNHSPLRAMMLLMALSLHSIFEGLAVGLQSVTGQVLGIFAALVLHKSILSFSIGMNLIQSRLSVKVCFRSIFFFSLTAPVGVAIGMLITDFWDSQTSDLLDGILTGIASGTFLYMTFFEVLPAEFNHPHDRMLKLLMLIVGFGTVTAILFLSDDTKVPFCKFNDSD